MTTNPFPSVVTGPATPITNCYHTDWQNRDQYRAGTQVLVLYSPDDWRRTFNEGDEVMLSDCCFGLVLRRMLNDQQRIVGARFNTREVLR